jgi:hypothetical protein
VFKKPGGGIEELPEEMPYITEEPAAPENACVDSEEDHGLKPYIRNLRSGAVAGFKYFRFDGTERAITMELRGSAGVEVILDQPDGAVIAEGRVEAENWTTVTAILRPITGDHALYFRIREGCADFAAFEID